MRKTLIFLGDIVILYASLVITLAIRYGRFSGDYLDIHILPFSFLFIIWLLVFYIFNLYELSFAKNNPAFFSALFYSVITSSAISALFFYMIPLFSITPKRNLFIFIAVALALMVFWRRYFNRTIARSNLRSNTLIIGENAQAHELMEFLKANPQLGYRMLGIVNPKDKRVLEVLKDLVVEENIKTVVLNSDAYQIPRIIDVFYKLLGFNIRFYNLSDFYEQNTGRVPLGAIDQVWFLENLSGSSKRGYEIAKRFFDVLFSIIIGIISLLFYPLITLAIKLDSDGNVFYSQQRVGKAGRVFTLIKFRTMFNNIEKQSGPVWASKNDPRITRVGRFLRRTRLDELPQLWNIFMGEMSFVGPRPERPEFHDNLKREIPFYEERYLIKPGLTGWAQIRYKLDFKDGMTVQDTVQKLQYDLYYIKNRSIPLDLGIILKTITKVLKSEGR